MITAGDANVLLDVFTNDPQFGKPSADALKQCIADGGLIACDVVWAEPAHGSPTPVPPSGRSPS